MLPISIVITTFNRDQELRKTLSILQNLEPVAEIIVVDNGSSDNTPKMIQQEFSGVKLLRLPQNQGVPAFGIGVQAANQPYVFLLDDDAVPERGTLEQVVHLLAQDVRIAVVACHILNKDGLPVTVNWPECPLCFWGCGAGLRKSAIMNQPYLFDPLLFLHGTEMDLAVRLYAAGYVVSYMPTAVVHHSFSTQNRSEARRIYFLVQSAIRFSLKHLPIRFVFPAIWRHLAWLAYRAWCLNCLSAYISGLTDAFRQLPSTLRERRPVPADVARVYYEQVWEYEPLTFRILRSFIGRPLGRKSLQRGFPVSSCNFSVQQCAKV